MSEKTAGDILKVTEQIGRDIHKLTAECRVDHAAALLKLWKVRAAGVISTLPHDIPRLVGVLSQSDISDKVVAFGDQIPRHAPISQIITTDKLVCVGLNTPIKTCLDLLYEYKIHHLVLVSTELSYADHSFESGFFSSTAFEGLVSINDVLKTYSADLHDHLRILENYIQL